MGAASSSILVHHFLGIIADEDVVHPAPENDYFEEFMIVNDDQSLEDNINCFNQEEDEDAIEARSHLIVSLIIHHSSAVQEMKKKKQDIRKMKQLQHRSDSWIVHVQNKKTRRHRPKYIIDPASGVHQSMTPTHSLWWLLYIQDPQPEYKQWAKSFRQQFRLPYHSFISLLGSMKQDDAIKYFRRWKKQEDIDSTLKMIKRKVSPMELLLLGSLQYLGRGRTFDDLEESTFIARDVYRCFFHKFIAFGAKVLYPVYIRMSQTL